MAGHSKWAGIKHKKAIVDSRRGKLFTKLARAITVAAKEGGGGPEVRHLFSKHGGSLGEPGSVAYLFDKKGLVVVDGDRYSEDDLMVAIDAGAEDIVMDDDVYEILCEPSDLAAVRQALVDAGVEVENAE